MVWAMFPRTALRFTGGEPNYYQSSTHAERGFCGTCGTPLIFRDATDLVSVPVGTLDNPGDFPPNYGHGGLESKLHWDVITDTLPRTTTDVDPLVQQSRSGGGT